MSQHGHSHRSMQNACSIASESACGPTEARCVICTAMQGSYTHSRIEDGRSLLQCAMQVVLLPHCRIRTAYMPALGHAKHGCSAVVRRTCGHDDAIYIGGCCMNCYALQLALILSGCPEKHQQYTLISNLLSLPNIQHGSRCCPLG